MNSYYHEFSVGFNWWMVVAAVSVAIMVLIGIKQYKMYQNEVGENIIRKVYKDKLAQYAATVLSVIFAICFVAGSWRGALQLLDNNLSASDSPVWSLLFLPFFILMVVVFFGFAIYQIARITAYARLGYLIEKRHYLKKRDDRLSEIDDQFRFVTKH